MLKFMRQILREDTGATAVEYGLIISLVVLAMITALQSVAEQNTTMWSFIQTEASSADESPQPREPATSRDAFPAPTGSTTHRVDLLKSQCSSQEQHRPGRSRRIVSGGPQFRSLAGTGMGPRLQDGRTPRRENISPTPPRST